MSAPSIDLFVEILINAGKAETPIAWSDRFERPVIEGELAVKGYELHEQATNQGTRFSARPKPSQANSADLLERCRYVLWMWNRADAADSHARLETLCAVLGIRPEGTGDQE